MTFVIFKKIGDKYSKKLMNTATKTEIDAAKTVSKRVVPETAETTGDLIRNKMADKTTSVGKTKSKKKKMRDKKSTYHQKKDSKLLVT